MLRRHARSVVLKSLDYAGASPDLHPVRESRVPDQIDEARDRRVELVDRFRRVEQLFPNRRRSACCPGGIVRGIGGRFDRDLLANRLFPSFGHCLLDNAHGRMAGTLFGTPGASLDFRPLSTLRADGGAPAATLGGSSEVADVQPGGAARADASHNLVGRRRSDGHVEGFLQCFAPAIRRELPGHDGSWWLG